MMGHTRAGEPSIACCKLSNENSAETGKIRLKLQVNQEYQEIYKKLGGEKKKYWRMVLNLRWALNVISQKLQGQGDLA